MSCSSIGYFIAIATRSCLKAVKYVDIKLSLGYYHNVKEGKTKYTVSLPNKVAEKLDSLAIAESMSKPETLRRAIALYSFVYKEVLEQNNKLCILDENDKILKEVLLS